MVRKKIHFESSMVERVRSSIRGNLSTEPVWWGAIKRVPPPNPPARMGALPRITFALEDRLRQKYLERNPHARDEAIDLSRGSRKAVRRSQVWRFVYEWIVAMEDMGLPEEEAYRFVEARQQSNEAMPSSPDVTHLSLQWARLTDASISDAMREVADAQGTLPPNWSVAAGGFESAQPGANVLVRSVAMPDALPTTSPGAIGASQEKNTGAAAASSEAGAAAMDEETREVVEYARAAVSAKVERLEAQLAQLLAETDAEHDSTGQHIETLEQADVHVPSLPEEVFELRVGATSDSTAVSGGGERPAA